MTKFNARQANAIGGILTALSHEDVTLVLNRYNIIGNETSFMRTTLENINRALQESENRVSMDIDWSCQDYMFVTHIVGIESRIVGINGDFDDIVTDKVVRAIESRDDAFDEFNRLYVFAICCANRDNDEKLRKVVHMWEREFHLSQRVIRVNC